MAKKRTQVIKVKDYSDTWVNHLAVIETMFGEMEDRERDATMDWLVAKYGAPQPRLVK